MTINAFVAAVTAAHVPGLELEPGMVCQLWEDGEVTLTKGGELFGYRKLHMLNHPHTTACEPNDMPVKRGGHGYALIRTAEEARAIACLLDQSGDHIGPRDLSASTSCLSHAPSQPT